MNGFKHHGINHLSASSSNLGKADRALWGLLYLCGVRGTLSLPAARGIAGEEGVAYGLKNLDASIDDCIKVAVEAYNAKTALSPFGDELRCRNRNLLQGYKTSRTNYPGIVRLGVEALRPRGVPTGHGEKIQTKLEGCPVPVIGFKDFSYDQHGLSIDLKCTERSRSEIYPDHKLQLSIYWLASQNQTQQVAYVTPKETMIHELSTDEARRCIAEATHIAKVLGDDLSRYETGEEFVRAQIPDKTSFRWHEAASEKAFQIFGF